ncbi:MAG: hypothetical protein WCK89_18400 [bacterium]
MITAMERKDYSDNFIAGIGVLSLLSFLGREWSNQLQITVH